MAMGAGSADGNKLDTAQRILAAAERLFGERGYNGASIQNVAVAAGVSKANVFHHYNSKAALYDAVLHSGASRFNQLLQQLAADERSLSELLDSFSREHLHSMLQHQNAVALFVRHLLNADDGAEATVAESVIEQSHGLLMEAFTALQQRGKLAAHVDPNVLALTLIGSHLAFVLIRNISARSGQVAPQAETFSRAMVKQLLDGVAPRPALSKKTKQDE